LLNLKDSFENFVDVAIEPFTNNTETIGVDIVHEEATPSLGIQLRYVQTF
jgi:hypothetical protein